VESTEASAGIAVIEPGDPVRTPMSTPVAWVEPNVSLIDRRRWKQKRSARSRS
jgi:hypothetical protein